MNLYTDFYEQIDLKERYPHCFLPVISLRGKTQGRKKVSGHLEHPFSKSPRSPLLHPAVTVKCVSNDKLTC